jgi:iron(III) transport system substrate-binding protein
MLTGRLGNAVSSGARVRTGAMVACLALLCAACGSLPTGGGADASAPAVTAAEQVFAKAESLSGQAQTDYLVGQAKSEGNQLTLYSSYSEQSLKALVAEFEKKYGITVQSFRSTPEAMNQRVQQESQAGYANSSDVIESRGFEMYGLNSEGLIRSLKGDFLEKVPASGVFDGWTADRFNLILPSWNTALVTPGGQPKTWQELADPKWKGKLAIEQLDDNWYQTMHGWLTTQGWTEQQADDYFAKVVANSRVVTGHTQMAQFLAAGQFAVAVDSYSYVTEGLMASKAPIAYRPAIAPAVSQPNGIGLLKGAPHPAAAALFYRWILTDAQSILEQTGNTASTMVPKDLQTISLDISGYATDSSAWSKRYDALLRTAGTTS